MIAEKRTYKVTIAEIVVIFFALLFLTPFYFVIINSLKPFGEILKSAASLPKSLTWGNYSNAFEKINFLKVFFNSLLITTITLVLLVIIGSMTAWWIVRYKSRFTTILFFAFIAAMITPFQAIMIPLIRVITQLNFINTRIGLIIVYMGYSTPFTVFLYHGFIKSVPIQLEEAAIIDGCSIPQIFSYIVIPLIKSMTTTVLILQALLIWNDFLLPLLILTKKDLHTIPLAVFSFFGQYTNRWDYALATLVLGMLPIIIFFLVMQKYVISGVRAGSVKG